MKQITTRRINNCLAQKEKEKGAWTWSLGEEIIYMSKPTETTITVMCQ